MAETKTGILPKLTPDDRCPCCGRQWLDVSKRGCLICESSRQERLVRQALGAPMANPETKTVLGRVFTKRGKDTWVCITQSGAVTLYYSKNSSKWFASLTDAPECSPRCACSMERTGPTETDAILALQRTLRKIAELEVVRG